MRKADVVLCSVAAAVVLGATAIALRAQATSAAAESAPSMSAAEERDYRVWQETQACIRGGNAASRPAGMTEEKFCQAYAMVQAVCRSKGRTGGACE